MKEVDSEFLSNETNEKAKEIKGKEILSGSKSEEIKIIKRGNQNISLNISYEYLFKIMFLKKILHQQLVLILKL